MANDNSGVPATSSDSLLREYQERQAQLVELLGRQQAVAEGLEAATVIAKLTELRQRVLDDRFRVLVLGDFKSGKSTLINAMFGQKVLPAYVRPTTAVINEIRYDNRRYVMLYPRNGQPAFEISVEDLEDHVVIDANDPNRESPYERAEVFWPLDLCRDGVEIVDSPGLNEDLIREKVTLEYLGKADAVVFVVSFPAVLGTNQRRFLEQQVLPFGHDEIFFVCTRVDLLDQEDATERDDALRDARGRLVKIGSTQQDGHRFTVKNDRVFFVNGRGALEARTIGNQADLNSSGLPPFEDRLKRFLTTDKGRVKLAVSLSGLRDTLQESRALIRRREQMYASDYRKLVDNYKAQQPQLDSVTREQNEIVLALDREITSLEGEMRVEATQILHSLARRCPEWAREATLVNKIGLSPFGAEERMKTFTDELCGVISERIHSELSDWQETTLQPLLERRLQKINAYVTAQLTAFDTHLIQIRDNIAGEFSEQAMVAVGDPSSGERVLAGVAGLFLGDPGLGLLGARFGLRQMAKAALPQLAVLAGGLLFGLSTMGLGVLLAGASAVQLTRRLTQVDESVREQVGDQLSRSLEESASQRADDIAARIACPLREHVGTLEAELLDRIKTIREQVEVVLRDMKAGGNEVKKQQQVLDALAAEIDVIEEERQALLDQLLAS